MKPEYLESFSRCIGIITEEQLKKIKNTTIAIGGLGLGGTVFLNLVRMGFESFHVADPDTYDRSNMNRQRLAKQQNIGLRKDELLIAEALEINPDIKVKSFPAGVTLENADEFLDGVEWVVEAVDVFAFRFKMLLNEVANKRGVNLVAGAYIGFSSSMVIFDKFSPSFAELSGANPALSDTENLYRYLRFIVPEVPEYMAKSLELAIRGESYVPSVGPSAEIIAGFMTTEIVKQVLGIGEVVRAPQGIHINPLNFSIERYDVSYLNDKRIKIGTKDAV